MVTISGREIGVFNVDGEFFALLNRCPHEGAALCRGVSSRLKRRSPGKYRLCAGRDAALPLARLGVRHPHRPVLVRPERHQGAQLRGDGRAGRSPAKGPFAAETVSVAVEQDYVVLTL